MSNQEFGGDMPELIGRVALVTGAASGIGRETAIELAECGAVVAVVDIDLPGAQAVVAHIQECGQQAWAICCDVTVPEQIQDAVTETATRMDRLDILVNNAGISPLRPLDEISLAEWNNVLATNLTGPFLFIQAALPYLKAAENRARVINIGSLAGQNGGISVGAHYTASKGGLIALTKQVARVLAPTRGTANAVSPGTTETALTQGWPAETRENLAHQIPLGRLGSPGDVAHAVLFLASPEAGFITGATINVNGGLYIS